MAFDAADLYVKYLKAYQKERGSATSNGETYPRTTWGDVVVFYTTFLKTTKDWTSCVGAELTRERSTAETIFDIATGPLFPAARAVDQCRTFLDSDRYKTALKEWEAVSPDKIAFDTWGIAAVTNLTRAILGQEEYVDNYRFWRAARRYAIARAAAGMARGDLNILVDSVGEAVEDLPTTVKGAIGAVNPMNLLPNISPLVELIKWGSILGGLGLLYWYVLRPKK